MEGPGDVGSWGGGVVVSEFSGAWGKRDGGGRERVELPDSLMNEAVLQSAPCLETPQSPP